MWWMLLVLFYGILKGTREIIKKKALQNSTVMEVLFFYTFLAFLFVLPQAKDAGGLEPKYYFYIGLKSFLIFLAWICSFKAISRMPISLYGVLDLSRVLFATLLGVLVLHETLSGGGIAGLLLVSAGLLMLKCKPDAIGKEKETIQPVYVFFAFGSCMLNAVSGLMDKLLMKNMNSSQLQFWYMLFLLLCYTGYLVVTRTRIRRSVWKNGWIWLLAILFVVADKALFIANGMEQSRITVMTLLKQSGCIVTIMAGKFIFQEKNIGYKLFCASVVLAGIVVGVM